MSRPCPGHVLDVSSKLSIWSFFGHALEGQCQLRVVTDDIRTYAIAPVHDIIDDDTIAIDNHFIQSNKKKSLSHYHPPFALSMSLILHLKTMQYVGAYSDGNAMITLDEWEVNVAKQRSNRKPRPGTHPDDVWKSLLTDGKGFWRKIPLDDRKRVVALFAGLPMPMPKKDMYFHPSLLILLQDRQVPPFPHPYSSTSLRHFC